MAGNGRRSAREAVVESAMYAVPVFDADADGRIGGVSSRMKC
jgi:hypothetical protein